jgi:hypothetical protein
MKPPKEKDSNGQSGPTTNPKLTDQDKEYLKSLLESEFQAIDQFDKTILALAGGAFGVSFAFLKDIVKPDVVVNKNYLVCAWVFWCITLAFNLTAFYFSHLAMRGAQRKYRVGERDERKLRGFAGNTVMWLNPITGGAFIAGLICMSVFVTSNLHDAKPVPLATNAPATTATNAPATTATNAPATTATNTPTGAHTEP